ncbi:NUDIX domain-containing protein, partial [Cohnella yongneupensis]
MELRQMATAFLFRDQKVLMIKKSKSKLNSSEFWSGLGGHLEPQEINSPKIACIREIFEESGIKESEISDLRMRYLLIRIKDSEIRQQYVYFGRTMKSELIMSDEGELSWVDQSEIVNLNLSMVIRK